MPTKPLVRGKHRTHPASALFVECPDALETWKEQGTVQTGLIDCNQFKMDFHNAAKAKPCGTLESILVNERVDALPAGTKIDLDN